MKEIKPISKFSSDKILQEMKINPIFCNYEEEWDSIKNHHFPRSPETIKKWALEIINRANIPTPESVWDTWFIKHDNGIYEQIKNKRDIANQYKGKTAGNLKHFLSLEDKNSIEYAAIEILEEIELLEKCVQEKSINSIIHHTMNATALYIIAFSRMAYSTAILRTYKQLQGTKEKGKSKIKDSDKAILLAYEDEKKNVGELGNPKLSVIAAITGRAESTVSKCLARNGIKLKKIS